MLSSGSTKYTLRSIMCVYYSLTTYYFLTNSWALDVIYVLLRKATPLM